jgi:hypothetical protein
MSLGVKHIPKKKGVQMKTRDREDVKVELPERIGADDFALDFRTATAAGVESVSMEGPADGYSTYLSCGYTCRECSWGSPTAAGSNCC